MVRVRFRAVIAALLLAPLASAHTYEERGAALLPTISAGEHVAASRDTFCGVSDLCRLPNSVLFHVVEGVMGGDSFELRGYNGEFVCGNPPCNPFCIESVCFATADYDLRFSSGVTFGSPGAEEGTVPADGHAVVFLYAGSYGDKFVYREAP